MSSFEYSSPVSIVNLFLTRNDVADFLTYLIEKNTELNSSNRNDKEYLPPVVYYEKGRAFNIDYNFIVDVMSEWVCETAIYDDFRLNETQNESSFRNAIFLVVGILEQYYRVVYMNNSAINLSRYKSKQSINITQRFYNMMIMKNGNSYRQYSAVGFSASSIKSLVPAAKYAELMKASTNSSFEMAAFGVVNCRRLMNEITEDIPHVTS